MTNAGKIIDGIYDNSSYRESIATDIFPMAINRDQGEFLVKIINRYRPDTVIELGFRYGISSLWIQSAAKKPARHIIIDPYHHIPSPPKKNTIDAFIKKQKGVVLEERVTSQEFLAGYLQEHKTADMVFIDASQWFDSVMTDLFFVSRILKVGGIVVLRNIWSRPVRRAVMYYLKNLPYSLDSVSPWKQWVITHVPVFGELLLRASIRPLDLCVMRLVRKDVREWDHYVPF